MQYPVTIKQKDGTEKTFWLSDEKLQFGGTDSGVTDVKVNGTSIVDGGVANVPIAINNSGTLGAVQTKESEGIYATNDGTLNINPASQTNINGRTDNRRPIVSSNLDAAVKAALTDARKIAYTDAEKASARATIGAISSGDIPYVAGGGVPGISAVAGTYGMLVIPDTHYIAPSRATEAQIDSKTQLYTPITPYNLDYAVKASLSHSTVEWTDAETAAARDVLGVKIAGKNENKLGIGFFNDDNGVGINTTTGAVYTAAAYEEQIRTRASAKRVITPYYLNTAVKAALTDANKMTMTAAEQASARETLGLEEMMLGNSKMHLIGTQTLSAEGKANVTFTEEVDNAYVDVIIPIMSTDSVSVPGMLFQAKNENDAICGTCWISGITNLGTQYAHQATMFVRKEAGKYITELTQWTIPTNGQATQRMINDYATSFPNATKRIKKFVTGNNLPAGTVINVYGYNDELAVSPMTKRKRVANVTLNNGGTEQVIHFSEPCQRFIARIRVPQTDVSDYTFRFYPGAEINALAYAQQTRGSSTSYQKNIYVSFEIIDSDNFLYYGRTSSGDFNDTLGGTSIVEVFSNTQYTVKAPYFTDLGIRLTTSGKTIPVGTVVEVFKVSEQGVPRNETPATLLSTTTFDGNTDLVAFDGGSNNYSAIFFHYKSNVSTGGDSFIAYFGIRLEHSWAHEIGSASIKPNQAHLTMPMFSTNNIVWSPCINGNQAFTDNFSNIKTGLINTAHIYFTAKPASGTVLEIWGVKA